MAHDDEGQGSRLGDDGNEVFFGKAKTLDEAIRAAVRAMPDDRVGTRAFVTGIFVEVSNPDVGVYGVTIQ
jgi:hypothetical protein